MRVCVIGAGIGGLTLAQALRAKLGNRAIVKNFERDASEHAREQGYGLTLRGNMGFQVLEDIGLGEDAVRIATPVSDFRFTTSGGTELMRLRSSGERSSRFFTARVRRNDLRSLLLRDLETTVVYGHRAVSYSNLPDGTARVDFENGASYVADVVVAADGVNSALRKQMVGADNTMLDVTLVSGRVRGTEFITDQLNTQSTLFTLGNGDSVFCSFDGEKNETIWAYGCGVKPGTLATAERGLALAIEKTAEWKQEPIARLLQATSVETVAIRELVDRKIPTSCKDGRVVLLGDAAHPMTPYQGLGANTAMLDAMDLAGILTTAATSGNELDAGLSHYDATMISRATGPVLSSRKSCLSYHRYSRFWTPLRNLSLWSMGWLVAMIPAPKNRL